MHLPLRRFVGFHFLEEPDGQAEVLRVAFGEGQFGIVVPLIGGLASADFIRKIPPSIKFSGTTHEISGVRGGGNLGGGVATSVH